MLNMSPKEIVASADAGLGLFTLLADPEATKVKIEEMKAEAESLIALRSETQALQKEVAEDEAALESAWAKLRTDRAAYDQNLARLSTEAATVRSTRAKLSEDKSVFELLKSSTEESMADLAGETKALNEQAKRDSEAASKALVEANRLKAEYDAKVAKLKEIAA